MARILIIDDDESLLHMMTVMLKRAGHTVLIASHPRKGVETVMQEQPDLVIIDVMMPDADGYQVTQFLKREPRTQHIPIMILTALPGNEQRMNAEDAGANAFVTKPVTLDMLREEVNKLLADHPPSGGNS